MGLLDGRAATNSKRPDRMEASARGKVPIDRPAESSAQMPISRAGRGFRPLSSRRRPSASGMEVGFHPAAPATATGPRTHRGFVARHGISRRLSTLSRRHRIRRGMVCDAWARPPPNKIRVICRLDRQFNLAKKKDGPPVKGPRPRPEFDLVGTKVHGR